MSSKKEIIRNLLSFGSMDILGLLIPIVTMPILTQALGPDMYGSLMLFMMILFFGHTIIDYGTHFTAVRALAKRRQKAKVLDLLFRKVQALRISLAFIYILSAIFYCFIFELEQQLYYLITYGVFYILGYAFVPSWFYQGLGNTIPLLRTSIVTKLTHLFAVLIFVKEPNDIYIVLSTFVFPMFFGGVWLSLQAKIKYKIGRLVWSSVVRDIKLGKDVFLAILAPNFYNSIPTIILGTHFPPAQFAQYAIASKLMTVVIVSQNVLAKSVYPVLSTSKLNQTNKLLALNFFVTLAPITVIYFFGGEIIEVYLGEGYKDSSKYLTILSIGVMFLGLSNAISKGYFLPKGFDKLYRNIALRASLVSGCVALYLIGTMGLIGGAIALSFARLLFFIDYGYNYINYEYRNKKPNVKSV